MSKFYQKIQEGLFSEIVRNMNGLGTTLSALKVAFPKDYKKMQHDVQDRWKRPPGQWSPGEDPK